MVEMPLKPAFPKWPLIAFLSFFLGVASVFAYQKYLPTRSLLVGPSPSSATVVSPSLAIDSTVGWKNYQNSLFGFSFLYPQELILYDQLKQVGDNLLLQNYRDVPNRKIDPSDFQLVLSVSKDEGKSLEEYPKLWESELGKLPTERVLIGNIDAIKGFSGQKYKAVPTVWVKNHGYLYSFQLSILESSNKELFDLILSTFKFIDQTSTPAITDQELQQGWYWGDSGQKKSGTPLEWVFQEAGRSSCWHQPGISCAIP